MKEMMIYFSMELTLISAKYLAGLGGLHEKVGDARRLAEGYKSRILVSLRVFITKHHQV